MYSMLFPRLLALAERAWHKASWENVSNPDESNRERTGDWVKFANTVAYRELGRLDKMGVSYHVAPPGARLVLRKRLDVDLQISHIYLNFFLTLLFCRIIDGKLHVKTALPGLKIEFSTDEGLTWEEVTRETKVNGDIKLRARWSVNYSI